MRQIILRHGDTDEHSTAIRSAADATPAYTTIIADPSDTLGTLAHRAYGVNTQEYRDRIERANPGTLLGTVRIPK